MSIRVRFAPSPTGYLHVGGARTALFNWLFARQNNGTFILRIEDTDVKRSDEDMVQGILEGLSWLGLDWDEGPYFQSQRLDHYTAAAKRLLASGFAYRDFSQADRGSEDHLEFRDLSESESRKRADSGESFAVRFKTPKGRTVAFKDLVFGEVTVETENIEDFVILRSDGFPTYHLSVVVDDTEMGITHVVRGADHLSNTSKHALLYEALGGVLPIYVHLPLILGLDKKRLSKRHGATSVTEYRDTGFLPEALFNYLALLGWSPGDDSEILSVSELTERFSLDRINKANAVFDPAKLEWLNKRYISSFPADGLVPYIQKELQAAGLWKDEFLKEKRDWFGSVLDLLKTRAGALADFPVYGRAFFTDDFEYEEPAVEKFLRPADEEAAARLRKAVGELRESLSTIEPFDLVTTEEVLREIGTRNELKAGPFIGAVRVATTGKTQAPGIFDVLVTLGRKVSVERLDRLIRFLEND